MSNSELFEGDTWYSANNPLLTHIPEFKELSEILDAIAFNPLAELKVNELSFIERDTLLTGEKVPFEPTMQSAKTVMTCYGMLKASLRARNPTLAQNQSYYWEVLRCANQGFTTIPSAPTPGLSIYVIKGITGTGKSVTLARLCALLPQVVQHGKIESAGWSSMRQLVYLNVFVSHDGSRRGFLHAILLEMDKALGTNYAIDIPKRNRTVETLAIAVIGRLIAHYCGIIFVDEAQLRNLVESGQADLMQMFLLLIMNSGIPLVISGNERAFDWVTYSQDHSRLNQIPSSHFAPVGAIKNSNAEAEWAAIYAGISSYYVLKNHVTNSKLCSETLWRCSGGIARLALTLWCTAQRQALFNGEESIDSNDIQIAYESGDYSKLRPLADGFYFKKPELLSIYSDVDVEFYTNHWSISSIQSQVPTNSPSQTEISTPFIKNKKTISGKTKLKGEKTRNKNKENKRVQLKQFMRPDDIRKQGLINYHLDGLAEMKTEAEKEPI
jgi:hypothetical protein